MLVNLRSISLGWLKLELLEVECAKDASKETAYGSLEEHSATAGDEIFSRRALLLTAKDYGTFVVFHLANMPRVCSCCFPVVRPLS